MITHNQIESEPSGGGIFYDVRGTGSCAQAATSTSGAPIEIGSFTFAGKFAMI